MAKVLLDKVTKKYPSRDELTIKETTLEIKDGEFMVLVGPSGCGKTTTLRMIAGLEEVTSGKIFIGDRDVTDLHPKDRNIAMVFQNYALYPHMNVFENMAFGLRLRGVAEEEIKKRVEQVAEMLGLKEQLEKKPRELSGGQRQRVALGRAIVREPDVFLMDEPLSNLDAKLRVHMRSELIKLHRRLKTTTVYVTHDQVEAMTMGDRIAIYNFGVIQQVGTPQEVYFKPANKFVAGFIGSPAMNFFDVKVVNGKVKIENNELAVNVADGEYIFGVRPEHLIIGKDGVMSGKVDVVEMLGGEKIVYVNTDFGDIVVKTDAQIEVKEGENIKLGLKSYWYLFDKTNENTVFINEPK